MPKYLAGRGEIQLSVELNLKALSEGYQTQPVTFYGLLEVGKTVHLNAIESIAAENDVLMHHVKVEENKGAIGPLASMRGSLTRSLSARELIKIKLVNGQRKIADAASIKMLATREQRYAPFLSFAAAQRDSDPKTKRYNQHPGKTQRSTQEVDVLTIHYGDMDNVIYNTSVYFDNVYSPQWFEDSFAQRVIKSIDKGTVVGPNAIDTKILGIIPPEKLSSGTKTLLLMYFMPQNVYNASNCGDNCAYWILRIAAQKDLTINLYHILDFGNGKFTVTVANTGDVVHTMFDLVPIAGKCLRENS